MSFLLKLKKAYLLHKFSNSETFKEFFTDIDLKQRIEDTLFTVFDTETTGLDPKRAELISIGAIKVAKLSLDLSTTFHRFLKPEILDRNSVEVHGITLPEIEKSAEAPEKVIRYFLEYVRGSVLVGFNVEFDRKMVEKYTKRLFGIPFVSYRLDVFHMWRRIGGQGKSLKEIAQELGIPSSGTHSALDDAYITALVFLKLVYRMRKEPLEVLPLML